jgi:signal transduction histidine kinase
LSGTPPSDVAAAVFWDTRSIQADVILQADALSGHILYGPTMASDPRLGGPPNRMTTAFDAHRSKAVVVLAAFVGLATIVLALGPHPNEGGPRLTLALLACGPMVLLRRWPLPVLAASVVAAAVVNASGAAPLPLAVVLGLAIYLVSSQLPRPLSIPATLAAAAAICGAILYAALSKPSSPLAVLAIEGLVPLGAAWFVGDAVAARRLYQAGLLEQAARERAMEAERAGQQIREERVRISQELHDVVAHSLAVITVQAGVGRRLMARRPEEASDALKSIEEIGRTAQEELRIVLDLLREEGVSAAELSPAPRLVDLKELVETVQASGTDVELWITRTDRQLSPALELSLYRVVQEALTNVVKHAPGAAATVEVAISADAVRVEVVDNGSPAGDRTGAPGRPGHGIVGMRERVGVFGGSLIAQPRPDGGFHVVAEVPVEGVP